VEKTIEIINELQKEGLIRNYAIGGGIATIFYIEPILTYDLDIFFIPSEEKRITTLSSIYDWLRKKGYKPYKEHIVIEEIPVQFIPVYNELVKEAVENSADKRYGKRKTRIVRAEYLIAIMLQTFRPKDRERIIKILDEAKIDMNYLEKILQKYNLKEKFDRFMRLYYGE